MSAIITLRKAVPGDQELLEYWDTKAHVIEAGGAWEEFDWGEALAREVSWGEFLLAELDGRPVGMMQVIDPALEETHYWGDCGRNLCAIDIWIGEEHDLGRGYGTQMMNQAIARCFTDPAVTAILIDPMAGNTRAHQFYERLGFAFIERRQFDEDDCFVHRLERTAWEPPAQE